MQFLRFVPCIDKTCPVQSLWHVLHLLPNSKQDSFSFRHDLYIHSQMGFSLRNLERFENIQVFQNHIPRQQTIAASVHFLYHDAQ